MKYHIDNLNRLSILGTTELEKTLMDWLLRDGANIDAAYDGKGNPMGFLITSRRNEDNIDGTGSSSKVEDIWN